MIIAALGGFAVPGAWQLTYSAGCLAALLIWLAGLSAEWQRSHSAVSARAGRLRKILMRFTIGFVTGSAACLILTIWFGVIAATVRPLQLIPHHPWDVRYGDGRIYVHARVDDTTNDTISFQEYGKALVEPAATGPVFVQDQEVVRPLRDEVHRLASNGGNPIVTANPEKIAGSTTFDIPGPVVPSSDFISWKSGGKIIYYDVLVDAKLSDGTRFSFENCRIAQMLPVSVAIPGTGNVSIGRQLNDETECDTNAQN